MVWEEFFYVTANLWLGAPPPKELGCGIKLSDKVWKHPELLLGAWNNECLYSRWRGGVCVGLILNPTLRCRNFDQSHQLIIFAPVAPAIFSNELSWSRPSLSIRSNVNKHCICFSRDSEFLLHKTHMNQKVPQPFFFFFFWVFQRPKGSQSQYTQLAQGFEI